VNQLPWYIQHWTGLKDTMTLVVAIVVASVALVTYRRNAKTKRAEFLTSLHRSFFVEETYKRIREVLDDDSPAGETTREAMVAEQPAAFTDFLNFFELIAYFKILGAYKEDDVKALLGYYLRLLRRSRSVYRYICDRKNDFENLQALLAKIEP
jgi:hypothetical protein